MGRKGQATRLRILESTITCLAKFGVEKTTFQAIAAESGVSQPLVVHYLKSRSEIFPAAIEFLLEDSLLATESALNRGASASELLREYLSISMSYFRSRPEIARVYLTFYYLSGFNKRIAELNDRLKSEATQRIAEILTRGVVNGEFKCEDIMFKAKMIHVFISGLLLNLATDRPLRKDEVYLREIEAQITCILKDGTRVS